MAEHHVQRRNRPDRGPIDDMVRSALQEQGHHRLQVRAGNERKAVGLQDALEFRQSERNLVAVEML